MDTRNCERTKVIQNRVGNMTLLRYVKLGCRQVMDNLSILLLLLSSLVVMSQFPKIRQASSEVGWQFVQSAIYTITWVSIAVFGATYCSRLKSRPVYLVDYACFRPPDSWRTPSAAFMEHSQLSGMYDEKSLLFQRKILERSGLGEQTALPPAMHYLPPKCEMAMSRAESETVIFSVLDELFRTTGIHPRDIGVLVVNCCLFYPVPSLSAMVVNKYKMRSNIKTYNLSGMGCAASLMSVDLTRSILQAQRDTYAIVVSADNMSGKMYHGNQRNMLISNCLFRLGGAAILLTNRMSHRAYSKYQLSHAVRTHLGADDKAYRCVTHGEDENVQVGVSLSKDLMAVAGDAVKRNLSSLAPRVLPISELLFYAGNLIVRKLLNPEVKQYIPDFKLAFEHHCIHAGGRAVIQELEMGLQLTGEHTEPSRMTLHRFGNTSSSSVWYELAYVESKGRVKEGDRVWQIGLGSGFKCCSVVWRAVKDVKATGGSPWIDCIQEYPVSVPEVRPF
eukprot:c30326_g1_i1 orf=187-1698(-)